MPDTEPRLILGLHVQIEGIEPRIWRELEVAADLTLIQLHVVLQCAFGWESYHAWAFSIGGARYGLDEDDESFSVESARRPLAELVDRPGTRFTYIYDFGDDWRHAIEVRTAETKVARDATCLAGARAGPPEDSGGIPGYEHLLTVLADPTHPEHADTEIWWDDFDSEAFDPEDVNRMLVEIPDAVVMRDELQARVVALIESLGEEHLPAAVREDILRREEELVPALIEIILDPLLTEMEAPGNGWAPIHAAKLLCEMRIEDAVEPLLEVLELTDWDAIVHDQIVLNLPRLGAAVVEPALDRLEWADDDLRRALLNVLANAGVQDERIYRLLVESLDEDLEAAAGDLADYGDSAALPLIVERFDALSDDGEDDLALIELGDSIRTLGHLAGEQKTRIEGAMERLRRRHQPEPEEPVRRPKIGRNDPCPCGSGKKYKKCHLRSDEAAQTP